MPTFLDVETTPDTNHVNLLPPITAPGNYKKPESVATWLAKNGDVARQEQVAKMALDPMVFRLRAIGLAQGVGEPEVLLIRDEDEEVAALKQLWSCLDSPDAFPIVGYNILGFDLPRLLWRSMVLGTPPPRPLDLRKYGGGDALDLMLLLKNYDRRTTSLAGKGFKTVCAILGIQNPLPDVDGSMVAKMSDDEVVAYNTNEMWMLQRLYLKMSGVYFPDFSKEVAYGAAE